MKQIYQLLHYHMNSSTSHLWANAEIVSLLVSNRHEVRSYSEYVMSCKNRSVRPDSEQMYNQFMIDCNRPLVIEKSLFN